MAIYRDTEVFCLSITGTENFQYRPLLAKDCTLAMVLTAVQHGCWTSNLTPDLLPYHQRRDELTVMDSCVLWGRRVIIPLKLQKMLLAELHTNHIGMSQMKALARSYIWWPQLNTHIEEVCHKCNECLLASNNPAQPHHTLGWYPSSHGKGFTWIMPPGESIYCWWQQMCFPNGLKFI